MHRSKNPSFDYLVSNGEQSGRRGGGEVLSPEVEIAPTPLYRAHAYALVNDGRVIRIIE